MLLPSLEELLALPFSVQVEILARLFSQSEIATRKPHYETTFLAIRDYRYGDPLRSLDFRGSARRNRWLVREWERQSSLRIVLWLDTTASMGFSPPLIKGEWMRLFAGVFGVRALARHHHLKVLTSAGEISSLYSSPRHAPDYLAFLEALSFQGSWGAERSEAQALRGTDLLLFISDFMDLEIPGVLEQLLAVTSGEWGEARFLQLLHPLEVSFAFQEPSSLLFKHLELSGYTRELIPEEARPLYQERSQKHWQRVRALVYRGGGKFFSWILEPRTWVPPLHFLFTG